VKRICLLLLLMMCFSSAFAETTGIAPYETPIWGQSTEISPPQLTVIGSMKPGDSYKILAVVGQDNASEQEPWVQAWLDTYVLHLVQYPNPRTGETPEGYIVADYVPQDLTAVPVITQDYGRLVTIEGRTTEKLTFEMINKQDEGYLIDDPPADALAMEDALRITLDALMEKYAETEATLKRFYIRYGHHPADEFYPMRWQFELYSYLNPLDGYYIALDSHTSEIMFIAGPGDGVG